MALGVLHNPLAVLWGWGSGTPRDRVRRRVYVDADGDVVRIETNPPPGRRLPTAEGVGAPRAGVPRRRKATCAARRTRVPDWLQGVLVIMAAVVILVILRAVLGDEDMSREECEQLFRSRDQVAAERICQPTGTSR